MNHHTTHQGVKVKPTEQIANSASTPKAGLFATLCRFLHTTGSGAPLRSLIATPLVALFALLALSVGVAQAEPPKLISYGNFADSPLPMGVAVDQPSSDVYVAGLFNLANRNPGHVDKFDALGKLLSPPSPFGEAFHSGAAVNPTNGDVYALDAFNQAIDIYDPSGGAPLSSFSVQGSGNFGPYTIVQIATDSAGNVYVPVVPNNEVQEYSPNGALLHTFTGSGAGALSGPTGVAVDSSGNVWVADAHNNRIEELGSTGTFIGEIKSEGVQAVSLDTHGDVFAIVHNGADFCGSIAPPCSHLVEYSSAGVQVADIGAGSFGVAEGATVPNMLAVNDSSGRVYVTDGAKNLVWIFGPPSAPVLGRELAAEVSTSEAKLGALINPGGIETSYRFEYDTTEYAKGEAAHVHGTSVPFPEGNVGQGVTPRTVWAAASGLAPGTTYHYRVIVTNELGTVVGVDQTFTTETAAQASCPNEQLRGGFSASLPDCRAYELVTPPTKASTQPSGQLAGGGQAAREGNRMAYRSIDILPGSQTGGLDYVSIRGESGWSSEDVLPLQSYTADRCPFHDTAMQSYSADLSEGVLFDGGQVTSATSQLGGGCGAEGLEVVRGEPLGVENLLVRDNTAGAYQLVNLTPAGVTPASAHFAGASSDLRHVVFSESAQLTPEAPAITAQNPILEVSQASEDLYEWTGGVVRLVTILPNGAPVTGSPAAVSADGSRIFFTTGGNLYVRVNGSSTVQLDASQAGGSGGGGSFQNASADGSQVFFTDDASAALTSDTVSGSGTNLYRYAAGHLTDLTPASHTEVRGVSGVSEDGSYVYFLAKGSLAAGATEGQPNLYLYHDGTTTFIATLSGDGGEVLGNGRLVSPNGTFLAFASPKSLTGYDNTDPNTGLTDPEIFLYSASSNQLNCASCNPSGEPPTAGGATEENSAPLIGHHLSDSGRVFFDTTEALLPSDTNGQADVYEYESGRLHLISAGTSSSESKILDSSQSGNDVFFLTRQKLVPQDTQEEARNIYDARVDGGFPAPASPPACTTADACRSAPSPQPSIFGSPSSATFSGTGNLAPSEAKPKVKPKSKPAKCKKGFVKKKGKCVKKPKKKAKKSAHANKTGK
jgi:hypothetical protein